MRTSIWLTLVTVAVLAIEMAPTSARAASFDCAKAATVDERAVCGDPKLSALDSELGLAYAQARSTVAGKARVNPGEGRTSELTRFALSVLAARRRCGQARACLMATYLAGLDGYRNFGSSVESTATALDVAGRVPASSALPVAVGDCASTRVKVVSGRLEGDSTGTTGTTVVLANGGALVSYERVAAAWAARPGDPVVMCLVSVPTGCPPGDDRGRVYLTTDRRTGLSWMLPDAEHMCGGA